MHSLKKQFANKVKLIYIDPPYNTGGTTDSFAYNNTFNHSTWLTFMKNRLEVAKNLLREDGFIAITIDHCELFYLGVLADEIFERENRLGIITIVHKPDGRQFARHFGASTEYMVVYAKNVKNAVFNKVIIEDKMKNSFNLKDKIGEYKEENFIMLSNGEKNLRINKPKAWYPIYVSEDFAEITLENKKGYYEVFPITNKGEERTWKTYQNTFLERLNEGKYIAKRNNIGKIDIFEKWRPEKGQTYKTHWVDSRYNATAYGSKLLDSLLGEKVFSYPKSLYAVIDTLKIMTSKDDIILDFFAGSGTTAHAVLELNKEDGGNRQFILCEQMDYINNVTVPRIEKVIEQNEEGGFIYFELKKYNLLFEERLANARDTSDLLEIWQDIRAKSFLHYNVDVSELEKDLQNEESEFLKLDLNQQIQFMYRLLDNNQMYVNLSSLDDTNFECSEDDKLLTRAFYGEVK